MDSSRSQESGASKAGVCKAMDKTAMWARSNGYEIRTIKSDSASEETKLVAKPLFDRFTPWLKGLKSHVEWSSDNEG